VLPVGKLAISQFMPTAPLNDMIGRTFSINYRGHATECIPLPHPSGASPWHRMEPGKTLLRAALTLVAKHSAIQESIVRVSQNTPALSG
jgi:uracil-DNA glycosylase